MTQEQRNDLGQVIGATAIYYGRRDITPTVISMFIDDLYVAGLSFDEAVEGYKLYRQNSKNRFFPIPASVIEIMRPEVSPDNLAREASARIVQAITKFGYDQGASARLFIGDLGWGVVQRFGGWQYLCENVGSEINVNTFMAQARDLAIAHNELSESNVLGQPIQLPENKKQQGLTSANDVMKLLNFKPDNEGA